MRRAYGILAWVIVALGLTHMAATWRVSHGLTTSALWFFSAGITILFTGAVNLLNRAYGTVAPGLRWFSRGSNIFMVCFTALSGVVGKASVGQLVIVVGLFGAVAVLSWMPSIDGTPPLRSP